MRNAIKNQMKIVNVLFLIIIIILWFMSFIALIVIHGDLYDNYSFSFSPTGFNVYISTFEQYKVLFASSITTITAYGGLHKLQASIDANKDRIKQDRFVEGKARLEILFMEVEKKDPYMKKAFIKIRYNLFCQIYAINFSINSIEELVQIFQNHFQDKIGFFEEQNEQYIAMGGIYQKQDSSYSLDSFNYLLLNSFDDTYPDITTDLKTLYLTEVSKMSNRIIDEELYKKALIHKGAKCKI